MKNVEIREFVTLLSKSNKTFLSTFYKGIIYNNASDQASPKIVEWNKKNVDNVSEI